MAGEYLREAFPLWWPERQKRTPPASRRNASFKTPLGHSINELLRELKLLGALDVVISTNVPTRRDGLPYSDAREPDDPGVAVYFDRKVPAPTPEEPWKRAARSYVVACDVFRKVAWNVRAIGLTIEALRAIQRHGASEMLEQAFTGFAALPPKSDGRPWWEVLGVPETAGLEEVRNVYRELARIHHPDQGGDPQRMAEINAAFETARRSR